jgi:excisionase family DNA binding protein
MASRRGTVTVESPILPPTTSARRAEIAHLQALVLSDPKHLTLSTGDDHAPLPDQVVDALRQALVALAQDQAVTIFPTATLLTTQQAADVLGVSRPTIIKILDAGEIPYITPGRHRRISLTDVLAYQQRSAAKTSRALDELMQDSAEFYTTATSADHDSATR